MQVQMPDSSMKMIGQLRPAESLSELSEKIVSNKTEIHDIKNNFSASGSVFGAVDAFFDLGRPDRFHGVSSLAREDRQQFYRIVGMLLQSGYIGYETLVVDNKVERHDVVLQIGDRRLKNAKPYRGPYPAIR